MPKTLETERLILRQFQHSDWDDLHELFSDEECVKYTTKVLFEKWQTWRMLACYPGHWQYRGYGPYAVVEKTSQKMIGPIGLWYPGDWPETEIKYSICKKFWGKGYAYEAALKVKQEAFSRNLFKRLISLIVPENKKSISLSKKLGGVKEKTISFRGKTADIYVYK